MLLLLSVVFFKINFYEKFYQEYHPSVNSFDQDKVRHFVGYSLGPNCLQGLAADGTSR